MHQLARQRHGQAVHHGVHILAPGQRPAGLGELGLTPGLGLALQGLDQRHAAPLVQPLRKALYAGADDGFGMRHRGLAAFAIGLHLAGEVVHGVEVDVLQAGHLGLDVARHGQVQHQHRAALAGLERALHGAQADQRQAAGGAADDDVELAQHLAQFGQRQLRGPQTLGQQAAALGTAVGHAHLQRLLRGEMGGDKVDHLACADEQHAPVGQVVEQLLGQAHGRGREADGVAADLGAAAHLLGHRKAALEHLVQRGAQRAGAVGLAHGGLHLAEDLRLAEHHGVQPRGDAEGMARSVRPGTQIAVVAQLGRRGAAVGRQPFEGRLGQLHRMPRAGGGALGRQAHIDLGAVAGGQDGHLGLRAGQMLAQALHALAERLQRNGEAAAQVQRRAAVVQSQGQHRHARLRPQRP
mmetsp:Transcript_53732/g.126531  ORF Transcript_53732/g.126531 Transcript_53732/m.126531 type:complete len:410 (-) Transcript_53732:254-1483(-)